MKIVSLTTWVILFVTIALLFYDLIVVVAERKMDDTITSVIRRLSMERPALPFAFGLLMGHFFLWQ